MARKMSPYVRGASTRDRIWAKIEPQPNGCWQWTAATDSSGYPCIGAPTTAVHRWMYAQYVGPIPKGLTIDHLCRNTRCVNPAHLEAITIQENIRRARAGQTHCKHGHEFNEANTYLFNGKRHCRPCNAERARRYQARKRAAS